MPDQERERRVVGFLCERMSALTRTPWSVVSWPDADEAQPGGCDAIVSRAGEPWALDHTRLQSFRQHYGDNFQFQRVVVPARAALAPLFPGERVNIAVRVRGLPPGNRDELARAFRDDCAAAMTRLPVTDPARREYRRATWIKLPSAGCEILASRQKAERSPGVFVSRILPDDQQGELAEELATQLGKKQIQLARQKDRGMQTMLVLDTEDFASLNETIVAEAFETATRPQVTDAIDEVFLVDEHTKDAWVWPLRFRGVECPDERWYSEFRRAQSALEQSEDYGEPYLLA